MNTLFDLFHNQLYLKRKEARK